MGATESYARFAPRHRPILVGVTPPATLATELASARRRGELFEQVWPAALEAAVQSEPVSSEQRYWRATFTELIDVWHDAFERRAASRSETALYGLREPSRAP